MDQPNSAGRAWVTQRRVIPGPAPARLRRRRDRPYKSRLRVPTMLPGLGGMPGAPLSWTQPKPFARLLLNTQSVLAWLGSLFLSLFMSKRKRSAYAGHRLRLLMQSLGGLWVPFAQLLSRQMVRFSSEFCQEIKQTQYPPVSFSTAEAHQIIALQLGRPVERLFVDFESQPLAALPFAQVFRATVRRGGRETNVIVRVLEPGARERLAGDMYRIRAVARLLKLLAILPASYAGEMLDELDALRIELTDYRFEVAHLRRLRRSLRSHKIEVVKVFRRLSGANVLTTEYIPAPSLDDFREARQREPRAVEAWCDQNKISLPKVGRRLLNSYLRQLCEELEFDRNFPPRHVILLRNSRIALVGVRSARSVHRGFRTTYAMFLRSMALGDSAKAADCLFLLCDSLPSIDLTDVKREVVSTLRDYSARVRLHPSTPDEKSLFKLFSDMLRVLERHGIYVSWQFFDVQLGWSQLDESLRMTIPEDNMLKRLRAYFAQARRREWETLRRRGLSANAASLTTRISEMGMFQMSDLRRSARVFQAVVGKGAFVFAGLVNSLKWLACVVGLVVVAMFVNQYFPGILPAPVASRLTEVSAQFDRLPSFGTWLAAIGAALVITVGLERFRRKFLVPEPVEARNRR